MRTSDLLVGVCCGVLYALLEGTWRLSRRPLRRRDALIADLERHLASHSQATPSESLSSFGFHPGSSARNGAAPASRAVSQDW